VLSLKYSSSHDYTLFYNTLADKQHKRAALVFHFSLSDTHRTGIFFYASLGRRTRKFMFSQFSWARESGQVRETGHPGGSDWSGRQTVSRSANRLPLNFRQTNAKVSTLRPVFGGLCGIGFHHPHDSFLITSQYSRGQHVCHHNYLHLTVRLQFAQWHAMQIVQWGRRQEQRTEHFHGSMRGQIRPFKKFSGANLRKHDFDTPSQYSITLGMGNLVRSVQLGFSLSL